MVLVGLSLVFKVWFCFVLVGNQLVKMAKNSTYVQSRSSPTRRRELRLREELRLGELKAQNFSVFATPRRGLLRLSVGPRLGEGPLRLGKLVVLFLFLFSVNSRNH